MAFAVLLAVPRTRGPIVAYLKGVDRRGMSMLFLVAWITGWTVLLFVTLQAPDWALHARYMSAVWPFLAFVPVLASRLLKKWGPAVVIAYIAIFLVPLSVQHMVTYQRQAPPGEVAALRSAPRVVVDTVARGNTLRMLWQIPDGTQVYVARPTELLADPAKWRDVLEPGDVYASYADSKELKAQRDQILALMAQRLGTTPGGRLRGVLGTELYVLGEKL